MTFSYFDDIPPLHLVAASFVEKKEKPKLVNIDKKVKKELDITLPPLNETEENRRIRHQVEQRGKLSDSRRESMRKLLEQAKKDG